MTPLRRPRSITNHIRLYSDDYAGEIQADYMNQDYGRDFYLALLRFDVITSRWLVISDNQFIDSSYFLSRRPAELAADLGRDRLPLVVRSRENGLGEGLRQILIRPGAETLNGFQFMPIRDIQARLLLRDALSRTPVRELDRCFKRAEIKLGKRSETVPALGISLLLRKKLGPNLSRETEDDLDLMEQGWAWWLEQEDRAFRVECWRGAYAPPLIQTLGTPPPVVTHAGERALAEIINVATHGSTYRWDIDRLIAAYKEELSQTPEGRSDMVAITTWYIQGRHRRFAIQHECNYGRQIQNVGIRSSSATMKETKDSISLGGAQNISPPADFLALLRRLSAGDFRNAMVESYSNLEAWWNVGNPDGLRRALDHFHKEVTIEAKASESYLDFAQLFVNFGAALSTNSDLVRAGASSLALVSILNISRRTRRNLAWRDQRVRIIECASERVSTS